MAPAGRARHRGGRRRGRRAADAPARPRARAGAGRAREPTSARPRSSGRRRSASGQLWIYLAQTAVGLGVLVLIVRRPPRAAGRARRPVLAGAAVAAAISVATGVAALPLAAVARERAKDVGLVTQDWVGWVGDVAKSQAIGAGFAALGGALLVFGMRRFGRALVDAGRRRGRRVRRGHDLRRPGRARPAVQRVQAAAGGRAAQRRAARWRARPASTSARSTRWTPRAARPPPTRTWPGSGTTKRVVLYDTLVEDFTPAETRLVVAHELGHVHHHDLRNGLHLARDRRAVRDVGGARCWRERLAPRGAALGPRAVPAVALALALVVPVDDDDLQPALARRRAPRGRVLAGADGRPGDVHRASSAGSRSRTSPTPIRRRSRASCSAPTRRTLERIGMAEAFER